MHPDRNCCNRCIHFVGETEEELRDGFSPAQNLRCSLGRWESDGWNAGSDPTSRAVGKSLPGLVQCLASTWEDGAAPCDRVL